MLDRLNPVWIDDPAGVRQVADACRAAGVFALDTEADSLHSYFHKTCLVQVSAGGRHFVVDPLAMPADGLGRLWEVCADVSVPVVMHGSDYDIRVLDRDYGARIRTLRDTQIVAQVLGEPKTGLAALLEERVGVRLDKKYQRADWGRRPLTSSMLAYASADTAFLEQLLAGLRCQAEELGRWDWALEEFRGQEAVHHREGEPDPLAFERVKGVRALKGEARNRAHALFTWRDQAARNLDIPPFKILGNRQLLALATRPPKTEQELTDVDGLGHRFARRWGSRVLALLSRPGAAPERQRLPHRAGPDPEEKKRLAALMAARDTVAAELKLEGGLLCPRALAVEIATRNGGCATAASLAESGLRGWRHEVLARAFVKALNEAQ